MHAKLLSLAYHLPSQVLTTSDLVRLFPGWDAQRLALKTGIKCRHIASPEEYASDLGVAAGTKVLASSCTSPEAIDYLLVCTQSPDYVIPNIACLIHDRLGLPERAGALDLNLGCSGFIYGLGLAEALIQSGQARTILFITTDTYSKYLKASDKNSRAIFGDGAAATLIGNGRTQSLSNFRYGTDGKGAEHLISRGSGLKGRRPSAPSDSATFQELFMNGEAIFRFATTVVPSFVEECLFQAGLAIDDVDLFVFHQANAYLLEEIRSTLGIAKERFQVTLEDCGNTISSSIPIAICHAIQENKLPPRSLLMLVGFGVGLSWGATLVRWEPRDD